MIPIHIVKWGKTAPIGFVKLAYSTARKKRKKKLVMPLNNKWQRIDIGSYHPPIIKWGKTKQKGDPKIVLSNQVEKGFHDLKCSI